MTAWLGAFLDEHAVSQQRIACDCDRRGEFDCVRHHFFRPTVEQFPERVRGLIRDYGACVGSRREEDQWPIVKASLSYHNDRWRWPHCDWCGIKSSSCDKMRWVGDHRLCYACFDKVRFHAAGLIRATLHRFALDAFLPGDVRCLIYWNLYCLMLRQ